MECDYQAIETEKLKPRKNRFEWKSFLRQAHISSGAWMMFYVAGLNTGATTVFLPQLRKDSNYTIDDELASWLYSVSNITAIPWVLILPSLTQYMGRKPGYILTCLSTLAVYIVLYFSTTPYEILLAGVIQGLVNASTLTIMSVILIEYSSVKYRGMFINITAVTAVWGMWTSNIIGTYFYWKYIAVVGIICSAYTFTIIFYPESPIWLASKGKYKKAEEAYKWLHGDSEESMKELQELLKSLIDKHDGLENKRDLGFCATIRRKEFYQPLLFCVIIGGQYNFSGKNVCSTYSIEVLSKVTDSETMAHTGMLILDGVTILGMYFGLFLTRFIKRRTLYFTSTFMSLFFLLMISLYLYLVRLLILSENNIIAIFLLVAYSLSISCGTLVLAYAIYSEIIPLKYQRSIYMISSICIFVTTSTLLKLAPTAFKYLGIDGIFLFNCITFGITSVILYIYLPDTEGKTLLEIENLFKDNKIESFNLN